MKKLILTYGTIAALIIVAMLIFTFTGMTPDFEYAELMGYTTMILAFSSIFVATNYYKKNLSDNVLSFKEALKIGLGITLVATVIYILAWMIMSNTIAKDFMADYFQNSVDQLKASGLSQTEIDAKIIEMENFKELYKNPIVKIGMTFMEIFPVGFVVSLISAFIFKTKKNDVS